MQTPALLTVIILSLSALSMIVLAAASVYEHKRRAAFLSMLFASISVAGIVSVGRLPFPDIALWGLTLAAFLFLALFYLPIGRISIMESDKVNARVDERDTIFARLEYYSGSDKHTQYYDRHPETKETDERLRQLPELLSPGGRYYSEERSNEIKAVFAAIKELTTEVDGEVNPTITKTDPAQMTGEIKQQVALKGASDCGMAVLNPMHVYSHVGRGPEVWGKPITLKHRYAIVFTLEMDYEAVDQAPALPITEEAAKRYLQGATISVDLARRIRGLGYSARAHISDSNYQIMLPPVAQDAGLGELSRMGYLITPKLGPRVRLGAVTTDLPLLPDKPVSFGVQDFCKICLKCADNCPSAAIPKGDKSAVRGVEKWSLNVEQCLRYWRIAGTDCGLCMRACPYSHPPTLMHNLVRAGIRRSSFARQVALWGDDLFYGRKVRF